MDFLKIYSNIVEVILNSFDISSKRDFDNH